MANIYFLIFFRQKIKTTMYWLFKTKKSAFQCSAVSSFESSIYSFISSVHSIYYLWISIQNFKTIVLLITRSNDIFEIIVLNTRHLALFTIAYFISYSERSSNVYISFIDTLRVLVSYCNTNKCLEYFLN